MRTTSTEFSAILRTDFLAFACKFFTQLHSDTKFLQNWHHEALCFQLDQILAGQNTRLIINLPPRSLKSFFVSVAFPAFALAKKPNLKIVCASYSQELAAKHASDFRRIVESTSYRSLFQIDQPLKSTEAEYQTAAGGFRYATSVGGTLTGRGGDIIIVDDPLNAAEALSKASRERVNTWFTGTLLSRLDNKQTGAVVVVMQRLHQEDLSGFLLDQGDWKQIKFPAIAPDSIQVPLSSTRTHRWNKGAPLDERREPVAVLNAHRASIGTDSFNSQYFQEPVPETGNMLKKDWIRDVESLPQPQPDDEIVQSWDTAQKATDTSDFSVCLTFRIRNKNEYYLLDIFRDRLEFPELAKLVVSHAQKFQADSILIEDHGSGTSLIQDAKRRGLQGVVGHRPSSDKASRMQAQTPKLESGSLFLPKSAPWRDDFLFEYKAFPKGRHDDQIDALSQFLQWRQNREDNSFSCDWGFGEIF